MTSEPNITLHAHVVVLYNVPVLIRKTCVVVAEINVASVHGWNYYDGLRQSRARSSTVEVRELLMQVEIMSAIWPGRSMTTKWELSGKEMGAPINFGK